MPGTMALTYDDLGTVKKIIADWTSSTSGVADATTKKIVGSLIKGVTDPSTDAPTDDYDIVITDPEGFNVLTASNDDLADRDTANTEEVYFSQYSTSGGSMFPVVCDKLTITVTNAGDTKGGQLILYYGASA